LGRVGGIRLDALDVTFLFSHGCGVSLTCEHAYRDFRGVGCAGPLRL